MIPNLRDIGGCPTAEGPCVARGILFRSAAFSAYPSAVTHPILGDLGIRRVIDLRTGEEVAEAGGCVLPQLVRHVHSPFLQSIDNRSFQPIDRSPRATAERYYEYLMEGRASVAATVASLVSARSEPTLIHCVAGRDRTGIVVACLLSLLAVADELIARDYAASHVMDDAEGRHAHPENILGLLQLVRARHGSVHAVLTEGSGAELPLAELRRALVEA